MSFHGRCFSVFIVDLEQIFATEMASLTLFRIGLFGDEGMDGGQKGPPSLKSVTHILK